MEYSNIPNQSAIEYLPLTGLIPYARNARTHSEAQIAQLAGSIREFGFTNPVLIDSAGGIIAGHGRVMAGLLLGMETVPCIRLSHLTDAQRRAYILADNRLALNAGWDQEFLAVELDELRDLNFDITLMGFTTEELNDLIGTPNIGIDLDEVPTGPVVSVSRAGDVWRLGKHSLLCGDSSRDAAAFLSGVVPDLLFFDPPYEVADAWAMTVPTEKALVFTDHKHIREAMSVVLTYPVQYHFVWDTVISWYTQNRPLCRHRSAFYCAQVDGWDADAATCVDGKQRDEHTVLGGQAFAGDYHYKPLSGGRVRVTTLYQQSKTLDEAGNGKPVAWIRALLAGAQAREVYEPFAGTGATIIAAPGNCRVHAIEIDPLKCDVIVARWETATGGTAVRA